jgi:hypothetical protein
LAAAAVLGSASPCLAQSATIETDKSIYRLGEKLTVSYTTPDEFPPPRARRRFDISLDHLFPFSDGRYWVGKEARANEADSWTVNIDETWFDPHIPVEPWFYQVDESETGERDRAYFWIYREVPSFPKAIDLGGRARFVVGQDVPWTVLDMPSIVTSLKAAHLPVETTQMVLYRLGETVLGGGVVTNLPIRDYWLGPDVTTGAIPNDDIRAPGQYELRLQYGPYILDRIAFEVKLPETRDALSLTAGFRGWQEATVRDPGTLPGYTEVEYFRVGREGDRQPASQSMSWIPNGTYEAQLLWRTNLPGQNRTYILDTESFSVSGGEPLPEPARELPYGTVALEVSPGAVLMSGQTVTVTAKAPSDMDLSADPLWFDVYRVGGYGPNCERIADEWLGKRVYADLSQPFMLDDITWPGVYEVRLYRGGDPGIWLLQERKPDIDPAEAAAWHAQLPFAELIAKVSFRVEAAMLDGALTIEGGPTVRSFEPVRLQYDIPHARFMGQSELSVMRLPEIVPGGATYQPTDSLTNPRFGFKRGEDWAQADLAVNRQGVLTLGAGWLPGAYEVRLSDRSSGMITFARLAFTIEDPALPPLPEGLVRPVGYSDWPREGTQSAEPSAHPPAGCALPATERMTLSFAHWSNGEIVPLDGTIDYGHAFFVEGRLETPATKADYEVQLEAPGGRPQSVVLRPTADDPALLRSELLYMMWDVEELPPGNSFATEGSP